ncbi:MAG: hypothetical protein SF187_20900 [Deltaproteobacteria bacterium]|nr:hypothetical protein [Deltaproteobacteria bacterium]
MAHIDIKTQDSSINKIVCMALRQALGVKFGGIMNLMRRLLPVVFVALALLPAGCSDEECTSGTVRVAATIPAEVAAGVTAVDVSFEIAGQLVHMQRLPVSPGAAQVEADITLPGGYPAGKRVVVTAVAKRGDVAVATWFASQEFPAGCIGFVFNLFPGSTMDGGTSEGGVLYIDGGAFEGGVDGNTADGGATDGAVDGAKDGGTEAGVDAAGDAANDAPAI